MRLLSTLAAGALAASSMFSIAVAAPTTDQSGMQQATPNFALIEQAQYVNPYPYTGGYWGGNPYCWYGNAWRGPGWYQCGYAWRRGFGWGGPWGWGWGRGWGRGWGGPGGWYGHRGWGHGGWGHGGWGHGGWHRR
ncbi:MAG: hypothetical protein ACYC5H_16990 [Methylovirgula sp.]